MTHASRLAEQLRQGAADDDVDPELRARLQERADEIDEDRREIPPIEADELTVYVRPGALDGRPDPAYHECPDCYGADCAVPWPVAIEAEATPCGVCCESFDVLEGPP